MNRAMLIQKLEKIKASKMPWPYGFPVDINSAANYWMEHSQPMRRQTPQQYYEFIIYTLVKFSNQTASDQIFITGAIEDGCYWRGDDMWIFKRIYSEHMKMLDIGVNKYREQALKLLSSMGGDHA
jgi:hypothetical protein